MVNKTDIELINGCIEEDNDCQRLLYNRYAGKMLVVCLRYSSNRAEAEDNMQDGFVRMFGSIKKFNFSGSFEGWLRRIMVNSSLRNYRKLSFQNEVEMKEGYDTSINENIVNQISEKELLEMVMKLPDGYRAVFNMFAIEGYEHTEIGEILGISAGTSRSQLSKARHWLQKELEKLESKKKINETPIGVQ